MDKELQARLAEMMDAHEKFKASGDDAGASELMARIDALVAQASKPRPRLTQPIDPTAGSTFAPGAYRGVTSSTPLSGEKDARGWLNTTLRAAIRGDGVLGIRNALTIGDVDTGHAVPVQLAPVLNSVLAKRNVFRKLVRIQPTQSEKYEELIGQGDQASTWVAETAARPGTTPVSFKVVTPSMGEAYVNVPISQQLVEDAYRDVGSFVVEEAGRQFAAAESTAIVSGDGVSKPKGFLTYTLSATPTWGQIKLVKSGVASSVTYDTLVDLVYNGLPAEYREGAAFVASPTALALIRKLKDSQNRPIWTEAALAGQPSSLLGYPVYESSDMPAVAASSNSIAFANWELGYLVAERLAMSVLMDPYSNKPYVNAYCRRRVGGCLRDSKAIAVYQLGV